MRLSPGTIGLAVVIAAAACGGGAAPAPPPAPVVNQDSINAANAARERARQDSIARAQQAERDRLAQLESQRRQREADSLAALAAASDAVKAMIARSIHFDLDKSNVRAGEDTDILNEKLAILQRNSGLSIEIVGHADERGSDEYNLALGNRRAVAAKQFLTGRGVDASRISTRSAGEEQPVDPGHTEDAWGRNRRAEFSATAGGNNLQRP
jgi:peptidoglycan-associated lipoprotein